MEEMNELRTRKEFIVPNHKQQTSKTNEEAKEILTI